MKTKLLHLILIVAVLAATAFSTRTARAQSSPWQRDARGLSINNNTEKKTAGLSFIVRAPNAPRIALQGGVQEAQYRIYGPIDIDLGQIGFSPTSGSLSVVSEETDWSHNALTFQDSGQRQIRVVTSRITPAMLVQASSPTLHFFTGSVTGNVYSNDNNYPVVSPRAAGPSRPKYVAYSSGGSVRVSALSTGALSLSGLDQNWIVVWYGNNSHFVDSLRPLSYTGELYENATLPMSEAYQADAPMMFVFQNRPASIASPSSGGISLNFTGQAGSLTVTPIYGRYHPRASETEGWSGGLPSAVRSRIQWWASRSCEYPMTVSESHGYNPSDDTASITETFTFTTVCQGGTRFAPLPGFVSIARDALGITFSGAVVSSGINTEFGPVEGIENVASYTWRLPGLMKYTDAKRVNTHAGTPPAELIQDLTNQIDKIVRAGHFTPWLFADSIPRIDYHGDAYFLNPAESLALLINIAEVAPEPQRSQLVQYIRQERGSYPPEDVYNLPLNVGTVRKPFAVYGEDVYTRWTQSRTDVFLKKVPLYNLYALYQYYQLTGDAVPAAVMQKASTILNSAMSEQDWATQYWLKGNDNRRHSVVNANEHFTGLQGFIGLSKLAGQTGNETLGRALLAKAAVLRVAFTLYPGYLISSGINQLPSQPDWMVEYSRSKWRGVIFNYNWTKAADDVRQVQLVDQFYVYLYDHSGYMENGTGNRDWEWGPPSSSINPIRGASTELIRYLSEVTPESLTTFEKKYVAVNPQWYATFAEGLLGQEHNVIHPIDSYQIFLINALVKGEQPEELGKYLDIPFLYEGDLYYIDKLAETIKSYYGYRWTNEAIPFSGFTGPTTIYLRWNLLTAPPPDLVFNIYYDGPAGNPPSPILDLPADTTAYTIQNLTTNIFYHVRLEGGSGGQVILSSREITLFTAKERNYLPVISRGS